MKPRCWVAGCRRRKGMTPLIVGADEYQVCWIHACEAAFLLLEWAFDPHRKRKHAAYSAEVIRRVNAEKRA